MAPSNGRKLEQVGTMDDQMIQMGTMGTICTRNTFQQIGLGDVWTL
jgi:DhnA family fructose-bisphosphate aldolase class Ia